MKYSKLAGWSLPARNGCWPLSTTKNFITLLLEPDSPWSPDQQDGEKQLSLGPQSEGGGISPVTRKVFSNVESFLMSLCWKLRCNVTGCTIYSTRATGYAIYSTHERLCYHQWRIWSYMLFLLCHNINDVIMHSWNELTSSSRQDDTLLSSRKKRHAQYLHIGYQDNYTNSSKWTVSALNSLKYTSGKLNMNSPELEHGITYTLTFYQQGL